jgi:hypothetical protein
MQRKYLDVEAFSRAHRTNEALKKVVYVLFRRYYTATSLYFT